MFYERIKELRLTRKMSQVQFAFRLNVTKQSISKWENAEAMPAVEMLRKICETFQVSADYLLGLDSQKTLDVSGLSIEQIIHLQYLIEDLKRKTGE